MGCYAGHGRWLGLEAQSGRGVILLDYGMIISPTTNCCWPAGHHQRLRKPAPRPDPCFRCGAGSDDSWIFQCLAGGILRHGPCGVRRTGPAVPREPGGSQTPERPRSQMWNLMRRRAIRQWQTETDTRGHFVCMSVIWDPKRKPRECAPIFYHLRKPEFTPSSSQQLVEMLWFSPPPTIQVSQ